MVRETKIVYRKCTVKRTKKRCGLFEGENIKRTQIQTFYQTLKMIMQNRCIESRKSRNIPIQLRNYTHGKRVQIRRIYQENRTANTPFYREKALCT